MAFSLANWGPAREVRAKLISLAHLEFIVGKEKGKYPQEESIQKSIIVNLR